MKTPKNLLSGYTAAVMLDVNAYIVASAYAGVIFANKTPGGIIMNANINVPIAVEEQMTQIKSGTPIKRFQRNTKHISKKLETTVNAKAAPIIIRGSVYLK